MLDSIRGGPDVQYVRALVEAAYGREAEALAALEKAYAIGFRGLWLLQRDPRLAPLRDEPAFRDLERRIADDLERMRAAALG